MSEFRQLVTAFGRPITLLGDLWDFFSGWMASRHWLVVLCLAIPFVALGSTILVLLVIGRYQDRGDLLKRYLERADQESAYIQKEKSGSASTSNTAGDDLDLAKAQSVSLMCYRRALVLSPENARARYSVASRYAERGSMVWARRMMEELAPFPGQGYVQAHDWRAQDLIAQSQKGIRIDELELRHHLKIAINSESTPIELVLLYARMLGAKKDYGEASDVLRLLVKREPKFMNTAAILLSSWGRSDEANVILEQSALYHEGQLKSDAGNEESRINASQAYLLASKFNQAIEVIKEGLVISPDSPSLRRAYSSILLEQFRQSMISNSKQQTPQWELLRTAIDIDPTNPLIGEQLAVLADRKFELDESLKAALEQQIENGKATPMTFLLVGNSSIKSGDFEKAKRYFEEAVRLAPNSPIVLNNYAMVLVRLKIPELEKAKSTIETALRIAPNSADVWDSKGRIYQASGDLTSAIASFEKSLSISPNSNATRLALIAAYREAGLPEMATAQEQALQAIRSSEKIEK